MAAARFSCGGGRTALTKSLTIRPAAAGAMLQLNTIRYLRGAAAARVSGRG
jgi:hypothetical protein